MKRLQRFKWIPMIVKAYSDARLQQEIRLRQQENTTASTTTQTAHQSSARQSGIVGNTKPNRQKNRAVKTERRTKGQHALTRPARNSNSYSQQSYRSVLHELRETKKKLNRLESIHTQLTEMQKNLDEKLVNLFERLETPSSTAELQSEHQEQQMKQSSSTDGPNRANQFNEVSQNQNHNKTV